SLDRRPRQDDAIDFLAFEQLRGMRYRKPGLAGAGGTEAEHELMTLQGADVGILRGGARPHRALGQIDGLEGRFRRFRVVFEQRTLRDHRADRASDFTLRHILSLYGMSVERFEPPAPGVAAVTRAGDGDVIAAGVDDD